MGQHPYGYCPSLFSCMKKGMASVQIAIPLYRGLRIDYLLRETFVTPYFVPSLTLTT